MPYYTKVQCLIKVRPNSYDFESINIPNIIYVEHFLGLTALQEWRRQIIMMDIEMAAKDKECPISSYNTVMPLLRDRLSETPFSVEDTHKKSASSFIKKLCSYLKSTNRP